MKAVLVFALLAPLAGAAAAGAGAGVSVAVGWLRIGAALAAAGWMAVLLDGAPAPEVGPFQPLPVTAAAAFGATLSVVAARRTTSVRAVGVAAVALAALGAALATGDRAAPLALGLAAAALAARLDGRFPGTVAAIGVAAAAVALAAVVADVDSARLTAGGITGDAGDGVGLLLALGACGVVIAAAWAPAGPPAALVPATLAVVAVALPQTAAPGDGSPATAVAAAAVALVVAVAPVGRLPLPAGRAAAVLGCWSVAALAAPGSTRPAGLLLAAGATVAVAAGGPAAALAGVPGAAALAVALADRGGATAVALGLLAVGTAVALARPAHAAGGAIASRSWWPAVPVLAAGAWLVAAPGSWDWTGPAALDAYDEGAAAAAASGLAALVLWVASRRRADDLRAAGRATVGALAPDPADPHGGGPGAGRVWVASALVMGVALALLVASA